MKATSAIITLFVLLFSVGCIDNPTLPDFVRLPFEGSGQFVNSVGTVLLEVEGRCDGYATGAAWITAYEKRVEPFSILRGTGNGIDGDANTDTRPCLRYSVQRFHLVEFVEAVESAAAKTGLWRVFISEVIEDGGLRRISSWDWKEAK